MYNRSDHPQVRYSLTQLAQGLFYHLQYRPLADITVTQICQKAGLTRRTFYRNCETKEDLFLYACDRLIDQLLANVDYTSSDARAMYSHFFRFWHDHRVFLHSIYRCGLYSMFADRFVSVCNQHTRFPLQDEALRNQPEPENARRFNNAFLLGGVTFMLRAWAEEDFRSSPEDLVNSVLFLVPREFRNAGDHLQQTQKRSPSDS